MNKRITFSTCLLGSMGLFAQTQISNGDFENWGNASPGNANEPTAWYSNKSGSNIAQLGPQTCFQENTIVHSGSHSVRLQTNSYLGTTVNGVVTTGVVDAPSLTKSDGYVGTVNYSTPTDDRRMAFTGRPDSIVGWYQYASGGAGEQGKVRVIIHTGDYYDPETPTTNHPDPTPNKIADALFLSPVATNVSVWTRFSVPFNYVSAATPAYIMINATASANQTTTVSGSQMWLDDLSVVYNTVGINEININQGLKVYCYDKWLYVDFLNRREEISTLIIYDLSGNQLISQALPNSKLNSLDLSSLNEGLYLYQLKGSNYQKTGKFILN